MQLSKRNRMVAAGAAVLALGAGGAAVAVAAGGGEDAAEGPDVAISGSDLEQASAAALAETGGGSVTETEAVEVTRDDGSQVDVQLDRQFNVVGQSADSEEDG